MLLFHTWTPHRTPPERNFGMETEDWHNLLVQYYGQVQVKLWPMSMCTTGRYAVRASGVRAGVE